MRGLAQGAVLRLRHARPAALPRLGDLRATAAPRESSAGPIPSAAGKAGQTCNTAAECCGLTPCVPDSTGTLRCLTTTPNDGGIVCVAKGGGCTATGDCCTGYVCAIDGETWTCGLPSMPPPADAGVCALYGQALQRRNPLLQRRAVHLLADQQRVCNGQQGCTCYDPIMIGAVTP